MVQAQVPVIGSKTVDQLLVEAGFEAIFKSRDIPPLIHYEGNIDGLDVEIEFLTDQTGSRPDLILKVQNGLHAEALRFTSIVVENAIEVTIDDTVSAADLSALKVKVKVDGERYDRQATDILVGHYVIRIRGNSDLFIPDAGGTSNCTTLLSSLNFTTNFSPQ